MKGQRRDMLGERQIRSHGHLHRQCRTTIRYGRNRLQLIERGFFEAIYDLVPISFGPYLINIIALNDMCREAYALRKDRPRTQ